MKLLGRLPISLTPSIQCHGEEINLLLKCKAEFLSWDQLPVMFSEMNTWNELMQNTVRQGAFLEKLQELQDLQKYGNYSISQDTSQNLLVCFKHDDF